MATYTSRILEKISSVTRSVFKSDFKSNLKSSLIVNVAPFLHDRPWKSPWIKSISNELDITIHVIASQLSGHCDVIINRLWRHRQNENRASQTRGRRVNFAVFIVIPGFVKSCNKYLNICTLLTNCFCAHSSVITCQNLLATMFVCRFVCLFVCPFCQA